MVTSIQATTCVGSAPQRTATAIRWTRTATSRPAPAAARSRRVSRTICRRGARSAAWMATIPSARHLASLRRDLASALHVWRLRPWLPSMSVLVYLITELPFVIGYGLPGNERGFLEILAIPLFVFSAGYVGAERLWYRRAWEERPFGPSLAWRASWGYVGRYLRLGLFAVLILVLFDLPWLAASHTAV